LPRLFLQALSDLHGAMRAGRQDEPQVRRQGYRLALVPAMHSAAAWLAR
jgi:hypothetical protein